MYCDRCKAAFLASVSGLPAERGRDLLAQVQFTPLSVDDYDDDYFREVCPFDAPELAWLDALDRQRDTELAKLQSVYARARLIWEGTFIPASRRLRSKPPYPFRKGTTKEVHGLYVVLDLDKTSVVYVGQTKSDIRTRLSAHMSSRRSMLGAWMRQITKDYFDGGKIGDLPEVTVRVYQDYIEEQVDLESIVIGYLCPRLNIQGNPLAGGRRAPQ